MAEVANAPVLALERKARCKMTASSIAIDVHIFVDMLAQMVYNNGP